MNDCKKIVEGEGIEPSKACAGRFTVCSLWPLGHPSVKSVFGFQSAIAQSWRRDSNPLPAAYKAAALPSELRQRCCLGLVFEAELSIANFRRGQALLAATRDADRVHVVRRCVGQVAELRQAARVDAVVAGAAELAIARVERVVERVVLAIGAAHLAERLAVRVAAEVFQPVRHAVNVYPGQSPH